VAINSLRTKSQLQSYLEKICETAVRETAKTVKEELTRCIDMQYYSDPGFYPNVYKRTEKFLNSVAVQMLSGQVAEVYVDIEGMHYKNNFSSHQVVTWASESKHGADYYQTSTQDFWTTFVKWCDENLLVLLKVNLMKYGIYID